MGVRTESGEAQFLYGRLLLWGTRIGLGLLIASFAAYLLLLEPHVPISRLPELWKLPAGEMLSLTGMRPGWDWASYLPRGDMLVVAAIAFLASCSIPCLLAVMPAFSAARERVFVVVCALEVAVLLLAASGLLTAGH